MLNLLRTATRQHWSAAGDWLFYTLLFGALPFWGVATVLWLTAKGISLIDVIGNGQLMVYAAGSLAVSIPVMRKEVRESPYRHPKWFLSVAVLVIALAALIVGALNGRNSEFDPVRLATLSMVVAFVSLGLGFLTELFSEIRSDPALWKMRTGEVDNLGERVRRKIKGAEE